MKRTFGKAVRLGVVLGAIGLGTSACGGASGADKGSPLMGKTFAGQNKCNPKNQDRPFIIDWDATDQSSFQARAATDVLVVHYEGCELRVLDGCANDSVKGALGAYRPIDWTSGQLESIDIKNDDELYAKLPLGAASLSARTQRGEKFHMEYFVSGTRTASRSSLYRADLDHIAGCKGATHYVYAFNLGAFALASSSSLQAQANGSYFGFGAGGATSSQTRADKRGGDLAMCQGSGSREVDRCKVPIRLALRSITEGTNPDVTAALSPETPDAANLAGKVRSDVDRHKQAVEHGNSAHEKLVAGDGVGCLAELDRHDQLDPSRLSTNPKGGDLAEVRVRCVMLAGKCDAGVEMEQKRLDAEGASSIDRRINSTVGEYCRGATSSKIHQKVRALWVLEEGATGRRRFTPTECQSAYALIVRLEQESPSNPASPDARIGNQLQRMFMSDQERAKERCVFLNASPEEVDRRQKEEATKKADADRRRKEETDLRSQIIKSCITRLCDGEHRSHCSAMRVQTSECADGSLDECKRRCAVDGYPPLKVSSQEAACCRGCGHSHMDTMVCLPSLHDQTSAAEKACYKQCCPTCAMLLEPPQAPPRGSFANPGR